MSASYKGITIPEYTDAADGPQGFQDMVDSGPVPRFATAGARDSAIPAPVEGQVVWVTGLLFQYWDGGAWINTNDHTHTYLPLTGGRLTGDVGVNDGAGFVVGNIGDPLMRFAKIGGEFDIYIAGGPNNGTHYKLNFFANSNDILDLTLDGGITAQTLATSGDVSVGGVLTVAQTLRVTGEPATGDGVGALSFNDNRYQSAFYHPTGSGGAIAGRPAIHYGSATTVTGTPVDGSLLVSSTSGVSCYYGGAWHLVAEKN